MDTIKHFLLVFDRESDTLLVERDLGSDADTATVAYEDAEAEFRDRPRVDVLLVGSDSIETVKVTHSTYFPGSRKRSVESLLDKLATI